MNLNNAIKNNRIKTTKDFVSQLNEALKIEQFQQSKGLFIGLSPTNKILYEAELQRVVNSINTKRNEHNR